jgi:15-cis-phytoene synthase
VQEGYRRALALTRAHAKSFHVASFALGGARRRGAVALYAFCRRLDDLVDEPSGATSDLPMRLGLARALVSAVHAPEPPADVPAPWHADEIAALRDTVRRFAIPEAPFQELVDGVEMDLTVRRYPTFAALERYCYRVAGTVGLMMTPVLGFADPAALGPAADLGRAMQLTNILRDVAEDLGRDRVYLPQDELRAAGLDDDFLRRGRPDDRFRDFMRAQVARARAYYARSRAGIPYLTSARSRRTVALMAALYGDILRVIEAQDYDVFRARAVVPGRRKMALAAGVLWRGAAA